MKKFLLIMMIFAALIIGAVMTGCADNDGIKSPSNTKSPGGTSGVVQPNATSATTETTGGDNDPVITESVTDLPSPTAFSASSINSVDEYINRLVQEDRFSIEGKNIENMSDKELKDLITNEAKNKKYNVYDLSDSKRSTVDSNITTVDVAQTIKELKNNDMASTRFVFKGGRVSDTNGFEKVAECKTPLRSKSKEAIENMNIANTTLNGIVLRSGEEFSFRFFLGEQTEEDGYKEATIYVKDKDSGEVEEEKGIAGGICQVSSTLHAACLKLKLKIKERHEHSKEVSYIEKGLDAAIAGDYYDLKVENSMDYPIAITFATNKTDEIVTIYKIMV